MWITQNLQGREDAEVILIIKNHQIDNQNIHNNPATNPATIPPNSKKIQQHTSTKIHDLILSEMILLSHLIQNSHAWINTRASIFSLAIAIGTGGCHGLSLSTTTGSVLFTTAFAGAPPVLGVASGFAFGLGFLSLPRSPQNVHPFTPLTPWES
jgi:hypothetical protein